MYGVRSLITCISFNFSLSLHMYIYIYFSHIQMVQLYDYRNVLFIEIKIYKVTLLTILFLTFEPF